MCRDMVLLVTPDVPTCAYPALAAVGWQVKPVQPVSNPGQWAPHGARPGSRFPKQFASVYTKLLLFNQTQYDRSAPVRTAPAMT